jgi:hypothetical protein
MSILAKLYKLEKLESGASQEEIINAINNIMDALNAIDSRMDTDESVVRKIIGWESETKRA